MRIKFLVKRSLELGLNVEAKEIERVWLQVAKELKITEDYFGFYDPSFGDAIYQTLNDMIIETNPISFEDFIKEEGKDNIIQLTNSAWARYDAHEPGYDAWEEAAIEGFLIEN